MRAGVVFRAGSAGLPLLLVMALTACQSPGASPEPSSPGGSSPAAQVSKAREIPGGFQLVNVPVSIALDVYRGLTGRELVLGPGVSESAARVTFAAGTAKREALTQVLEKGLREQAGIVVHPLDDSRVSVTLAPVPPEK